MKINKIACDTRQVFKMLGCKHFKQFPLFGDIDTSFCDCVLRTLNFSYYIIRRCNIFIVCCCCKTSNFCYSVSSGVL